MSQKDNPTETWTGSSKGTPLGYKIFIILLRSLGLNAAYVLLRFVALYYWVFSVKSSKAILSYYKRLNIGFPKSLVFLYKNYFVFGQTLLDKVAIMAGLKHKFNIEFENEKYLHQLVEKGKGGLLLSAHIGNWEMAGHHFTRIDTPINIVMFENERVEIKEYLDKVTGKKVFGVILIKNDLSHLFAINKALSENELVCIHADRFLKGMKTVEADFLGAKAKFPEGPFLMASIFKTPVSMVFASKSGKRDYHFYTSPPKEYTGSKPEIIQNCLSDYIKELESWTKRYKTQWFNYFDFWNT